VADRHGWRVMISLTGCIRVPFLTLALVFSSCGPPGVWSDPNDPQTLFKNPDPKVEALHVRAYNLDLGNGVKQDRVEANRLYLQAAEAGDPRSMMNYAINRFDGVGTRADKVDAYVWIDKARFATQHSRDLTMKWKIRGVQDGMKQQMSTEELRQAKDRRTGKTLATG
jgi:hypothetical protein